MLTLPYWSRKLGVKSEFFASAVKSVCLMKFHSWVAELTSRIEEHIRGANFYNFQSWEAGWLGAKFSLPNPVNQVEGKIWQSKIRYKIDTLERTACSRQHLRTQCPCGNVFTSAVCDRFFPSWLSLLAALCRLQSASLDRPHLASFPQVRILVGEEF